MSMKSLGAGISAIRHRPGLVFLLYGMNLALAFVLAVPLYSALATTVGQTGFGPDLARGFDLFLWANVLEQAGDVFRALRAQVFWMAPLYLVWKAAAAVGLVHALRGGGGRSFWQGVGRHTGRALLLALLFVPLAAGVVVGYVVATSLVTALTDDEVVLYWSNLVLLPLLLVAGLALLDLMHDYARIALVVDPEPGDRRVRRAFRTGFGWPFRRGRAVLLYAAWFLLAALLLAAPVFLDAAFTAGTAGTIWLLFGLQQALLVLRAAVTVGWLGSEVAFFEAVRAREAPLIAGAEPLPGVALPVEDAPAADAPVEDVPGPLEQA